MSRIDSGSSSTGASCIGERQPLGRSTKVVPFQSNSFVGSVVSRVSKWLSATPRNQRAATGPRSFALMVVSKHVCGRAEPWLSSAATTSSASSKVCWLSSRARSRRATTRTWLPSGALSRRRSSGRPGIPRSWLDPRCRAIRQGTTTSIGSPISHNGTSPRR